jgi:hypothetical protein
MLEDEHEWLGTHGHDVSDVLGKAVSLRSLDDGDARILLIFLPQIDLVEFVVMQGFLRHNAAFILTSLILSNFDSIAHDSNGYSLERWLLLDAEYSAVDDAR